MGYIKNIPDVDQRMLFMKILHQLISATQESAERAKLITAKDQLIAGKDQLIAGKDQLIAIKDQLIITRSMLGL